MASGLVLCRIQRPDTWQLRPATCKKVEKTLAKPEPSTHGAFLPAKPPRGLAEPPRRRLLHTVQLPRADLRWMAICPGALNQHVPNAPIARLCD